MNLLLAQLEVDLNIDIHGRLASLHGGVEQPLTHSFNWLFRQVPNPKNASRVDRESDRQFLQWLLS